jgi:DNA-binding LytR/AlgR family response regulator
MAINEDIEGYLALKVDSALLDVPLKEIVFVESFGNYVKVVSYEKTYLTLFTTKGIEALLPEQHFIRIHKSYIVNKHCILKVTSDAVVVNDHTLPIGKTYKQYFIKLIDKGSRGLI